MTWRALIDWDWQGTVLVLFVAAAVACALFTGGRRRAAGVVIILALGFQGSSLALPEDDDRSLGWRRWHLQAVKLQLVELADRLRSYKARHGRYPTNEEHMSVLDDFDIRFAAPEDPYGRPTRSTGGLGMPWHNMGRATRMLRSTARDSLVDQQEMAIMLGLTSDIPGTEIVVGKREAVLMFRDGLVCSPWGIPYVYENGADQPSGVYGASPAKFDSRGRYSVKVDDGVYIWSVGGQSMAQELSVMEWQRLTPRLVGGVLMTLALVIAVWWTVKRYRGARAIGWVALLVAVLGGAVGHTLSYATCYIMSPLFSGRTTQMVSPRRRHQ